MARVFNNIASARNLLRSEREFIFHLEEYIALREEILVQQNTRHRSFQMGAVSSAIIWGFLLQFRDLFIIEPGEENFLYSFSWWLPVFISVGGAWYAHQRNSTFDQTVKYLRRIQSKYASSDLQGFENILNNRENIFFDILSNSTKLLPRRNTDIVVLFWVLLSIISSLLASYFNNISFADSLDFAFRHVDIIGITVISILLFVILRIILNLLKFFVLNWIICKYISPALLKFYHLNLRKTWL